MNEDKPNVIAWPPLLPGAALAGMLLLGWLWPLTVSSYTAIGWIGAGPLLLGTALSTWGAQTMRKAGTNISALLPSMVLVTSGPFRFSRNPLYIADTLILLGLSLALNNLWGILALVPLCLIRHYGVILREERYLNSKFGDSYRSYCSSVRRYF